jgi:hypothetical protein
MSLALSVKESEMVENTNKTRHYRIFWSNDGRFRLSEKDRLFADMTALIKYYQSKVFALLLSLNMGDHIAYIYIRCNIYIW